MNELNPPGASQGPSRTSPAVVVAAMALLAALAWYLNPRQPDLKPAPLAPPSPICRNPGRPFVPSNIVETQDPDLERLPADRKRAALIRMNTTACTCGCDLSVIYCRGLNSACETSKQMLPKIISDAAASPTSPAKQRK